jgi:hypothetical protein
MMDKGIKWFAKMWYNIQQLYIIYLDLKSSIFKYVWLCHPEDFSNLLFEKCFRTRQGVSENVRFFFSQGNILQVSL